MYWGDTISQPAYHITSPAFTANGDEVFFTRTRIIKRRAKFLKEDEVYAMQMEIYSSKWDGTERRWSQAQPFPYNNILQYSVGDPFITPDGSRLYFVSDMRTVNSQGGLDIYYADRGINGQWSAPLHMGNDINSPGDERTPFARQGVFYFASNGHIGMGGLDMFKAQQQGGGWQVANMQYPVNSPRDDFGPYFYKENEGYFASNRVGGMGDDDIYSLNFPGPPPKPFIIRAIIVSSKNGKPIVQDNALVTFHHARHVNEDSITEQVTGSNGIAQIRVADTLAPISIYVSKSGYANTSLHLDFFKYAAGKGYGKCTGITGHCGGPAVRDQQNVCIEEYLL